MPKDFAKKKTAKKTSGASRSGASRQSKKSSTPITLWFFVILLVIGFISGLVYLKLSPAEPSQLDNQLKSDAISKPKKTQTTDKPKEITKQIPKSIEPKKIVKSPIQAKPQEEIPLYDLHEDLTNKEVSVSDEELALPENLNQYTYTMPCGSFRENYRAEELKAQIALTGNKSTITAVNYKNETWYRVQLGPFNKKRMAESIRHRLQDNNINGCIINRHIIK